MIELLFSVLLQISKISSNKEATKYLDKVYSLKAEWLEEYSKPRGQRNNSLLDELESELYLIAKTFAEYKDKK